jgi:hypothetical protein
LKVQHTAYLDDDLMLVGYPQGGGF